MSERDRPGKYDAVLGGHNPPVQPPSDGVVLGDFSRYTIGLKQLLQQQKWQAADLATQSILLEICQRQKPGFLRLEDLANIECSYWRTIDRLWSTYSHDRFGLSVQAEIWQSVGGSSAPDWDAWCRFGQMTGWCVDDTWLHWNDVRFAIDTPRGHLPRNGAWMGWGLGDFWVGCKMLTAVVDRLEGCQII
jgi:hypothetical protein